MGELPTSTLEEMCELIVDCPHFTPEWTDEGYIVIRNQNIRDGRLDLSQPSFTHREDFERRIKRAKPRVGDIIFTREAPMGEVCMVPEDLECCVGQRQVLLRPDSKVDGRYLFYALRSSYVRHQIFWNEGTGSTVSNVRIPFLKALNIPRLGKSESTIAEILSVLDDKIDLNRRMNETLEAMARAIFKDWFVDFGPTRAKAEGREPYLASKIWELFPDALDDEDKPVSWKIRRLEDYLELAYGKSLPAKQRKQGPVAVYGSGGVAGTHNTRLVEGPVVIVGRKGTVGSLYWEDGPAFPIDTVFYVVPRIGSMLFNYHLLASQPLRDMNTDAAVPGLNRGNVYRLEFPQPASELISAFDDMGGPLWKHRAANLKEMEILAQTRDLLLPKLMSGEIRLRDAEKAVEAVA